MCHASNRRNCLAACLAQERADRCRQAFPYENSSSYGNQTDVLGAASGKTSPYASGPRTAAIVDGKVVSRLLDQRGAPVGQCAGGRLRIHSCDYRLRGHWPKVQFATEHPRLDSQMSADGDGEAESWILLKDI